MMGVRHFCLLIPKMLSDVHGECTGSTAEANTLRTVLSSIAVSAKELTAVLSDIRRVQQLVAESAFEAGLVPLGISRNSFFGGIDGLATLWALGLFRGDERHFGY